MRPYLFFLLLFSCINSFSQTKEIKYIPKNNESILMLSKMFEVSKDSILSWNNIGENEAIKGKTLTLRVARKLNSSNIRFNQLSYLIDLYKKDIETAKNKETKRLKELESKKNNIKVNENGSLEEFFEIAKHKKNIIDSTAYVINQAKKEIKTLTEEQSKIDVNSKENSKKEIEYNRKEDVKSYKNQVNFSIDKSIKAKIDTTSKKYKRNIEKMQKKLIKDSIVNDNAIMVSEVEINTKKKKYKFGDEVDITHFEKGKFYLSRAKVELEKANYNKAIHYIDKSLSLNPSYTAAYILKGDLLASIKEYERALVQYKKANTLDSTNAQTLYNMGNCFIFLNKKNEALNTLNKSIKADSTYILAYNARAILYLEENRLSESLADCDKVLKLNSYFYPCLKTRGIVYYSLEEYNNAIRDFNELLQYSKTDASVYYLRGMAKLYNSEIYNSCMDFLTASENGFSAANKAIQKYCN